MSICVKPISTLYFLYLSLYPSGAVAAHELPNVGDGNTVEIADDAVLQAAGCNCKLECRLLVLIMVKAINQTTREAVTAAHAVDDIPDLILLCFQEV